MIEIEKKLKRSYEPKRLYNQDNLEVFYSLDRRKESLYAYFQYILQY